MGRWLACNYRLLAHVLSVCLSSRSAHAKAAKSFAWSISAPRSAPPSLLQVCFPLLSSPFCLHTLTLLCSSSSLSTRIWGKNHSPERTSESRSRRTALYIPFRIKRREMGPIFPFCNHFLCWSIERGISCSRGQVKLLHSLRTRVNKTASR